MIAVWMAYATAVGLLLWAATIAAARLLRAVGAPERHVWVGGLAGAAALPALLPFLTSTGDTLASRGSHAAGDVLATLGTPAVLPVPAIESLSWVGLVAAVGWLTTSGVLAARAIAGANRLRKAARLARRSTRVGRIRVHYTAAVGPGICGIVHPQLFIPEWVSRLPVRQRRWIRRHEAEHLRAWDLALHHLVLSLRILLPWNPAVWLLGRGLLAALETDCDRRVLRATPRAQAQGADPVGGVRQYAEALFAAATTTHRLQMALGAFRPGVTPLEHRIRTMTVPARTPGPLRVLTVLSMAAISGIVACEVPTPTISLSVDASVSLDEPGSPTPPEPADGTLNDGPTFTPYTVAPDIRNRVEVVAALDAEYPPLLRDAGVGGTTIVWFFIDRDGSVQDTRIQKSSGHDALDAAAIRVARAMRFTPALNRDVAVPVWVAFPITFQVR
jgi:protein TonB